MSQSGGMIAFELKGGIDSGRRFMNALKLFTRAVSLGDAESLAQHPASMTHSTYTPEQRAHHGISEGLVRLSVGLEDIADLLADVQQALATCTRAFAAPNADGGACGEMTVFVSRWRRSDRSGRRWPCLIWLFPELDPHPAARLY